MAHNLQYAEFNRSWDRYMEEFDRMAQGYIHQMTERHRAALREFQQQLHEQLAGKSIKFSKELLEWRRRQLLLAKCAPRGGGVGGGRRASARTS